MRKVIVSEHKTVKCNVLIIIRLDDNIWPAATLLAIIDKYGVLIIIDNKIYK